MTPIKDTHPSASSAVESGAPGARVGNFRWVICGLLFFATMINYMDRQIIGVLKPQLSHELGWTDTGYANIVSAFQLAYACGYLFGGRLMDRFGVRRGLSWAAFLWSVAAVAHGLVRTVLGFSIARLGLGLAEGGNFPAAIKTVTEWFPLKERALATGVFNSASNIGAIVCPLTVPLLAAKFGWPAAFYITGALGLGWIVAWALLYDSPETHPRLSVAERAYIEEGRVVTTEAAAPWLSLLRFRAAWAYMIAGLLAGPVWWFYLFWLPDFLQKRYHLTLQQTGVRVGIVYTMAIVGSIGGGWLAAKLIGRGWSLNAARKTSLLVCAVCVTPVFFAASVENSWVTVALVGLAAAAHQGWSANLYTFVSDTMPKRAVSSVVGLGGFVSGIASMGNAQVVGYVVTKTGSYALIFAWASTMYLLSLLAIQILVPKLVDARENERRVVTDDGTSV
ncbi:hexuronate transporter [Capsulimonas corticalis]|uniref:Hexuronate transporter n=1 Tax=Capsulimonas corticalis TaxID=2219043 RepID=A0A402D651_9BACT|nr:MFS transporter [Capsulimonas corticalis]BDI32513.1 hexuronate transporter [Capsulimonas corticalis]